MNLLREDRLIISLCDYSGNWPKPYADAGYRVQCYDLKKTGDIRLLEHITSPIHGLLAAPPCTEFTNSGAQYWKAKDADGRTLAGLSIVDACLRLVALHPELAFWALENPVGRLGRWLGGWRHGFDPCDYAGYVFEENLDWLNIASIRTKAQAGEKLTPAEVESVKRCNVYTKKTLLWGKFNIPVRSWREPIHVTAKNGDRYSPIHMSTGGKSEKTKTIRSETPMGFAQAFFEANQ